MSDAILRFNDVRRAAGLSRTTIWRKERAGTFPRHVNISDNCVGWLSSHIEDWIQDQFSESRAKPKSCAFGGRA